MPTLPEMAATLRQNRATLDSLDWDAPEMPTGGPEDAVKDARLKARRIDTSGVETLTMEELRERLPSLIPEAMQKTSALMLRVGAGIGKTHSAAGVLQAMAEAGYRALWCAARHSSFEDLIGLSIFKRKLWYAWVPLSGTVNDEPACRYADAQGQWLGLGYDAFDLCKQLCRRDQWIAQCPYRNQANKKQPLVFAMHQHLATGLAISKFHMVVIDELPLQAFVSHRTIAREKIMTVGANGPLAVVLEKLRNLSEATEKGRLAGKALFDVIGPVLTDAYAQVEVLADALPQVPPVYLPEDVSRTPPWYVFQLLRLAQVEYTAWQAGWACWAERVWVDASGLHMLDRKKPWDKLPEHMLILDATGRQEVYQAMLNREIDVYRPQVKRVGRVVQVVGRTNGKTSLTEEGEVTEVGAEALAVARVLAAGKPHAGIVCPKNLEKHAARYFGADRVLHHGALRGTNRLIDADPLIVIGSNSPNERDIVDMATALLSDRREPFRIPGEDGTPRPIFIRGDVVYPLTTEGQTWARENPPTDDQWAGANAGGRMIGVYADPLLREFNAQLREDEILQAVHRGRPNTRPVTVYLLTAIPAGEAVDELWQDPLGIPYGRWPALADWLQDQGRKHVGEVMTYTLKEIAEALKMNYTWASGSHITRRLARLPGASEVYIKNKKGGRPTLCLQVNFAELGDIR